MLCQKIVSMSQTFWQAGKYLVEFQRVLQKCPNLHGFEQKFIQGLEVSKKWLNL